MGKTLVIGLMSLLLLACGKQAPELTLEKIDDGNVLRQADWQGKWVYINYWAEWCKPCAEEVPELNAFSKAHPDVLVLGVNFDNVAPADQLRQANALRIEFPLVAGEAVRKAFPHDLPQGLPATFVFGPDGKLVDTLQGPQTAATLAHVMKL